MDLDGLLRDAVAREAARARSSERLLRVAAAESATLVGTLVASAERLAAVALRTVDGRTYRGVVGGVGRDFCVVVAHSPVFVSLGAVASVRGAAAVGGGGGGEAPVPASLGAVLGGLCDDRPRVQVGVAGEPVLLAGELWSVGLDLLTLRLDAGPSLVVALAAVHEVVLLER